MRKKKQYEYNVSTTRKPIHKYKLNKIKKKNSLEQFAFLVHLSLYEMEIFVVGQKYNV